jgi:hypothetical protein
MLKRSGERSEPWGTPAGMSKLNEEDYNLPISL